MESFDVLIIGAGAAGLMAALELAGAGKKVAVVEAHKQCGGRMRTVAADDGEFFELGAEFVHGNLPLTKELAGQANIPMYEIGGSIWQHHRGVLKKQSDFIEDYETLENAWRNLKEDMPVEEFLENKLSGNHNEKLRFSLKNYVEGYYAADISKSSLFALREEVSKEDEEQYRLEGGYNVLVNYLEQRCRKQGVSFFFDQAVLQLHWRSDGVEAVTAGSSFVATKAIITVSIGVLQNGNITFSPALPQKTAAAQQLGYGHVIKTNFLWKIPFWRDAEFTGSKNLADMGFLFSDSEIPTWWTRYPNQSPVLAGWRGGPAAKTLALLSDEELFEKSLSALAEIFDKDKADLEKIVGATQLYNWTTDPYFEGAYSYAVVNGSMLIQQMLEPVDATLFFAGEGLHDGPEIGTVEAALQSGRKAARALLAEV